LTLTPPPNMSGPLTLTVTLITVGADDVAVAGTTVPLVVDVRESPMLRHFQSALQPVSRIRRSRSLSAPLSVISMVRKASTIIVAGLPEGAALSAGIQIQTAPGH